MSDVDEKNTFSIEAWLDSEPWKKWKPIGLTGLRGSSKAYFLSCLRERVRGPVLIVVPHLRDAEYLQEDLQFFLGKGDSVLLFPQWETLPYDDIPPHPEIVRERVRSLYALLRREDVFILSSVKGLMQKVLPPAALDQSVFSLSTGEEADRDSLIQFLQGSGYLSSKIVEERGDFSVRGAIIDIFTPLYEEPLRLQFDGDRLESIRRFDPGSQRSIPETEMERIVLLPARDMSGDLFGEPMVPLLDYLRSDGLIFVDEGDEVAREGEAFSRLIHESHEKALSKKRPVPSPELIYVSLEDLSLSLERFRTLYLQGGPIAPPRCQQTFAFGMEGNEDLQGEIRSALSLEGKLREVSPLSILFRRLRHWQEKGTRVFIVSHNLGQAERLKDLFGPYDTVPRLEGEKGFKELIRDPKPGVTLLVGLLSAGFQNPQGGWLVITEEEIFGERRRVSGGRGRKGPPLSSFAELRENDFVVHMDYGVGVYRGLKHLSIGGTSNDYLQLEYLDGDKVYVPVDRLNLIQRYVGGDGKHPRLDKLGGTSWERAKKRAKAAVSQMVKEILELYAARQVFEGIGFSPVDQPFREFEATFEYEETPDQARAIEEVMADMGNRRPMDRLICGDVGFGKTEVAIRAAYRAVMDGKQVAILVPTTVLAQQHYQTFVDRFRAYPIVVEMLSRFRNPREQKEILRRLQEGKVDVVVGTHRLLQKDVVFRDLGLVVIDEEHRFGVPHKEKLKQMRRLVDVLTLTATPIPRTLQMAISGIWDLSLIQTPPENRLSIRTFVARYDDEVIKEAIQRELGRGGQVFFVHHRVKNIYSVADHLKKLVPQASLAVAHGQMGERDLEKVMFRFVKREYDVLVCTSIIESGLDIPAANTILINHAERFGLADLYQLRGRVGRGIHQAYAYFLIPADLTLSHDAMRRLRAIQELSELGSGFKLASQDLEIRGAGNLLGASQSGLITAVGLEFYTQLMERAVRELKGEEVVETITPEIRFHVPAFIPEDYMEDPAERLRLYRRLSHCLSEDEVEKIGEELKDRFGEFPEQVDHLLQVIKVKILLTQLSVKKLEETPSQMVLTFDDSTRVSPDRVTRLVQEGKGRYRLTPDSRLIVKGWPDLKRDPFEAAKKLLQALA